MSNSKLKFVIIALFAIGLSLTSCGNKSNNNSKTEQTAKQGKEYTSAYVCPMHCEGSGSETAGKCPVCKMDYVANEDYKGATGNDGHGHDHDGHNHDHDSHEGHNH